MRASYVTITLLVGCSYNPPASNPPLDDGPVDQPVTPEEIAPLDRVTAGLIGFWKFDDGTATIQDSVPPTPPNTAMNLTIGNPAGVTWVAGGLQLDQRVSALSSPNPFVNRRVTNSGGTGAVTVEVWVTPSNTTQGAGMIGTLPNYAVVFSISPSYAYRNLVIAQNGSQWFGRVSTSQTTSNGLPTITGPNVVGTPTHLVLVASSTDRVFYVNGVAHRSTPDAIGALQGTRVSDGTAVWNDGWRITIGDEVGAANDRHWLGTFWLAAVYDRELSESEIQANFQAGPLCTSC